MSDTQKPTTPTFTSALQKEVSFSADEKQTVSKSSEPEDNEGYFSEEPRDEYDEEYPQWTEGVPRAATTKPVAGPQQPKPTTGTQ